MLSGICLDTCSDSSPEHTEFPLVDVIVLHSSERVSGRTFEYLKPNSTPNYQEWCVPDLCDPQALWKTSAIGAASLLGHPYCCISSPDVSVHACCCQFSPILHSSILLPPLNSGESCTLQFTFTLMSLSHFPREVLGLDVWTLVEGRASLYPVSLSINWDPQ